MSMESSQRTTGLTPLPLTIVHLDKSLSRGLPKSEVSSSENNNLLETDSDEGHLSEHSPGVWEDTLLPSSRTDCAPPGTPTYIAKDAHSLTFQWEQSKGNSGTSPEVYSVQMQGVDLPSGALTPDRGSARTLVDPEAWEVVYKGKECWTKIKDLRPGRYYAIRIKCDWTSNSKSLFSSIVVFHTTPSVPTIMQPPSLIGLESSSLRLSWRDPIEDGGSEINGFRLQLGSSSSSSSDQDEFYDVYNGLERNFKVMDLEPFTKYNARVKAINEVGEGPWSLCSCFKTRPVIPTPPRNLKTLHLNPSITLLQWEPVFQRCRNPIEYELEMQDRKTGLCCYLKTGFETKHEIEEIEVDNEFQFRVRGMNEIGFGDWSLPITVLSNPVPPGPPSCPRLISSTQSTASFTWEAPLSSGGSPVSLYSAEMMSLESGDLWRGVYQGIDCACEVDGLIPGCEYRIRLRGIPGICGIPYSLNRTSDSIELQWTIPDHDGGRSIDAFRLEACPISDQKLRDDDLEILPFKEVYMGVKNQVKVQDLIPGVVYAVRVQAMNQVGISPWSEIGYESTKAGPPGAPEDLKITQQSSNSFHLKWRAPVNHGASISNYLVILNRTPPSSETGQPVVVESKEVYRGPLTECVLTLLLDLSSHYQIQLNAMNKHGSSPWSQPFCLTNSAAVLKSEALFDVMVEDIKSTSIKLSWTHPNINKNGVFIVQTKSERSEDSWKECYEGIECSCVIRNLTPKTDYLTRVLLNQGELKTKQISFQTKLDIPSIPRNLKITQITSSSMRVEWDEVETLTLDPKNHNSSLLYIIQVKQNKDSMDSVLQTLTSTHGGGGGIKVGSLVPNEEYEVQVAAENEIGRSPWSQPILTKTKLALPLPPSEIQTRIINTDDSELKLEVRWNYCLKEISDDFHKTQKFNLEIYGISNGSKKSRNLQNLFAKCSVSKNENSASFNVERSQKYELKIRSITNSGISGRWSKPIFIDTFGYHPPLIIEDKANSKVLVNEPKKTHLDSHRVQELDAPGSQQPPRRCRKGQVLIPQKQMHPLKRRKSFWKLLKSYKKSLLILISLSFLFVFMLIALNPAN